MQENECPVCSAKKRIRNEEEKKSLVARVNRLAGQMKGIAKMIEEDRYCDDILIQLSAIDQSVKSLAGVIFDSHLHTCVAESVKNGDMKVLDEISDLFRRFS